MGYPLSIFALFLHLLLFLPYFRLFTVDTMETDHIADIGKKVVNKGFLSGVEFCKKSLKVANSYIISILFLHLYFLDLFPKPAILAIGVNCFGDIVYLMTYHTFDCIFVNTIFFTKRYECLSSVMRLVIFVI